MHSERSPAIDIAKGLGIICVVLGHNWLVAHEHGELYRVIFSFHMPLFFFLSGVVLKNRGAWRSFAISRSEALLKPYLSVLTIWGLTRIVQGKADWLSYFSGMIYATGNTIEWVPLWYLPHLLLALLLAGALLRLPSLQRFIRYETAGIWLMAILLLLAGWQVLQWIALLDQRDWSAMNTYLNDAQTGFPGLPWSLDVIGISTAFILAGYACQGAVSGSRWQSGRLLAAFSLFITLHYFFDETIDLHLRHYGSLLICTLQAVSGIYIVLSVSAYLSAFPAVAAMVGYIGQGSLFILIFHSWIEWKVFTLLEKCVHWNVGNALAGLILGVALPLLLWAASRRSGLLSAMLLPHRK